MSPHAGTTRDVLEINLDIGGYPIVLCDTAGLRLSRDPVENEGLKRARETASSADLIILVLDASRIESYQREVVNLDSFISNECRRLNVDAGTLLVIHV